MNYSEYIEKREIMKKKILIFGRKLVRSGGVERYIYNLVQNIDQTKYQIDLLIPDEDIGDKIYLSQFEEYVDQIIVIPSHKQNLAQHIVKFYTIAKNYKDGIIHIHASDGFHAIDGLIAKMAGAKNIIYHSHNASFIESTGRKISRILYRMSGKYFIGCTKDAGEYLYGKKILNRSNFAVVANGINAEEFKFSLTERDKIRDHYHIPPDEKLLGYVGRFSQEKNIFFLLDVLSELLKRDANITLMLVGEGEEKNEIEHVIKERALENNVVFIGPNDQIPSYMSAMDILLLPSFYESLGIVLIEAQANGLRSIASDNVPLDAKVSECIEFVELDKNKWVNKIMDSKSQINRENHYKVIEATNYSTIKSSKKISEIYSKLLNER